MYNVQPVIVDSFGHRTITSWNDLPQELVNSTSVLTFGTNLDKFWIDKRYDLSGVY